MKTTLTRVMLLGLVALAIAAGFGLGLGKEKPAGGKAAHFDVPAGTPS